MQLQRCKPSQLNKPRIPAFPSDTYSSHDHESTFVSVFRNKEMKIQQNPNCVIFMEIVLRLLADKNFQFIKFWMHWKVIQISLAEVFI